MSTIYKKFNTIEELYDYLHSNYSEGIETYGWSCVGILDGHDAYTRVSMSEWEDTEDYENAFYEACMYVSQKYVDREGNIKPGAVVEIDPYSDGRGMVKIMNKPGASSDSDLARIKDLAGVKS